MSKKPLMSLLFLMAILTFSSCSSKLQPMLSENVKVEPQPLEVVGGQVPVTINAQFPAKWFNKKAVLTITPVLRYEGGEAWGVSYTYQGEKVAGNDQVVPFDRGANVVMRTSYNYKPVMKKSELYLIFDVKLNGKEFELPDIKIGEGIISTAALADAATATPAIAPDKFQRIIKEAYDANIMFLIQQTELRSNELNKREIADWKNLVQNANETQNQNVSIEISAYASPDGGLDLNTGLAEKREANTSRYLERELKTKKIDVAIDSRYTAQDWDGFQELVSKSNIQDKDLVLRVLSMYKDPQQREREIKNISTVFSSLADEVLPQLRRSRLTANIEIIGKSDSEIIGLAKNNPRALNVEELLYAATLTNDNAEKESLYKKATELYPTDYRTWNNLGLSRFNAGDLDKAEELFKKANSIKNNNEASMNLGLIALTKGDKDTATQLFGNASGVAELNEALGVLYLQQGDYSKAISAFGDIKSNNAALAQIMTKNYSKAQQTLEGVVSADATTDYLKAIVAARTNNSSAVFSNLKTAVSKNPSLAIEAAKDIEFAKYATNAAFTSIIK